MSAVEIQHELGRVREQVAHWQRVHTQHSRELRDALAATGVLYQEWEVQEARRSTSQAELRLLGCVNA